MVIRRRIWLSRTHGCPLFRTTPINVTVSQVLFHTVHSQTHINTHYNYKLMNTSLTYPKTGDKYLQFLLTESSGFLKSGKQNIPDEIGVYLYPKNIFVTTILDQNLVLAASTSKTCRPSLLLKSQVPIPQSHCHVNTGSIHKSQPTPESINQ